MEAGIKIKNKGQAQLFENPVLESLTKTRPWVIYSIYLPVNAAMLVYSHLVFGFSVLFIISLFCIAFLSWTLFEYIAHRWLFHYHPGSNWGKRVAYIFHGNHHEYPRDTLRLFMPPVPSILLALIVFGLLSGIIWVATGIFASLFGGAFAGNAAYVFIYFPGFITGYLAYVSMHYAIHAFPPPPGMKALWRNHHLHHYTDEDKGFGVSSPVWDHVFGTVPKKPVQNKAGNAAA